MALLGSALKTALKFAGLGSALKVVLRFGPLVAALALGLQAVLPASGDTIAQAVVNVLGFLGAKPDAEFVEAFGAATAGVVALVGVGRKAWSLFRERYLKPAA